MRIAFLIIVPLIIFTACQQDGLEVKNSGGFKAINHTESGIDFRNDIIETEEINVVNYEYLYNGGGVGVGDFNNDGLQDLFFTGTMVDDQLFINEGGFNFKKLDFDFNATEGFSTGVSVIDINNDGNEDIYISRTGKASAEQRQNLLFINDGNLNFSEEAEAYGINSDHHSNHSAFFDYDNDGDLDLYVLNHPIDFKNSQQIRVEPIQGSDYKRILDPKTEFDSDQLFRNNGNGSFTDISKSAGINNYGYGLSVSIVDVNNDSYPDIYVANDYIDTDILYVNQKDGSFKRSLSEYFSHITENSMGSDWADLNNDGNYDLMVVDMVAEDNFRQKTLVTSMTHERYHTLKNLNYEPQHMRNMLHLNNGVGGFSDIAHLTGMSNTDWSWAPLMIDLDNDGLKDVFISNGYRRDLSDCDYTLYKSDSLAKANITNIQEYLRNIPETPLQNYVFHNKGDLNFEKVSNEWNMTEETYTNGAAFADLNGDGKLDLILNNVDSFPIIYQNSCNDGNHFLRLRLKGPVSNISAVGTQLILHQGEDKQYQRISGNRGYFSSVEKTAHFGLKEGNANIDSVEINWGMNEWSVLKDLRPDSMYIIAYTSLEKYNKPKPVEKISNPLFINSNNNLISYTHKENPFDDLRVQHMLPHCFSNLGPKIETGVNNDWIFIGSSFGEYSLVSDKLGNIQKLESSDTTEDLDAVFFDADQDGDEDIYVVAGGNSMPLKLENYQDKYYENNNGKFQLRNDVIPISQSSGGTVTAMDYDEDGDMDLFVGGRILPGNYPIAPISYILGNEQGKFIDRTDELSDLKYLGMVTDSGWADIDGDNKSELVLAGEFLPVSVYKYIDQKFVKQDIEGLQNTEGWWNTIELDDVDGDGDTDIIAGNLGLNAKYKASEDKPYELYAYDFDNNGRVDPIACQYYGEESYPIPARGDLLKQLPVLQRRLVNYRKYATCKIEDLFSQEDLEKADHFFARNFASTLFENKGGSFAQVPLPRKTQFSPIYSIETLDYDGKRLILTGGNNIDAHVESGPYDAGRVYAMTYNSDGTWKFFDLDELGIDVDEEVRSLQIIDSPSGKLLLIAVNDGPLQVFEMI